MLYRIVYTSRATRVIERDELNNLCDSSTRRNEDAGITGLFLFDGTRFLQAIEGSEVHVRATMMRIAADERHHDITYAFQGFVKSREFPNWSMERPYGDGDPEQFIDKVKADVTEVADLNLRAHFIGFARLASMARNRV